MNAEAEFLGVRFFVSVYYSSVPNRNFELTPSSDIIIERFQSLTCIFSIFKGFVSLEAEFLAAKFFRVCVLRVCFFLMLAQNRKLGLTPSSDI